MCCNACYNDLYQGKYYQFLFFVMPYNTALQQKVMHYSNCIIFVTRNSEGCILKHKKLCQKRKLQGALRSLCFGA